jgi:hypothetical protein
MPGFWLSKRCRSEPAAPLTRTALQQHRDNPTSQYLHHVVCSALRRADARARTGSEVGAHTEHHAFCLQKPCCDGACNRIALRVCKTRTTRCNAGAAASPVCAARRAWFWSTRYPSAPRAGTWVGYTEAGAHVCLRTEACVHVYAPSKLTECGSHREVCPRPQSRGELHICCACIHVVFPFPALAELEGAGQHAQAVHESDPVRAHECMCA